MAVREGLQDADGGIASTAPDGEDAQEKIVYVLHPNCAVEELGADRTRSRRHI